MRQTKIKNFSVILMLAFLTTACTSSDGSSVSAKTEFTKPVELKFWSVHDDSDAYAEIIADYQALHPNVSIEYRKLLYEEYEDALIKAFAKDEGPDIFSIHNTWTYKYQDLIQPMPESIKIPKREIKGKFKKEPVYSMVDQKLYSPKKIAELFGDTVAKDVTADLDGVKRVYGLPLSLDTLALYYNKDILNNAGIPTPPAYWTDVQAQVEKITKIDDNGNILMATIPLGTARNITRSFDIVSLLMMQLRAKMIDDHGRVVFNKMPKELSGQLEQPPGLNALDFYTSFADPMVASYTWNDKMPNSLDAFIAGKTAYFLGYSYHRPIIQARAPKLNFDIAPMLQVQGYDKVNYANYWFFTVSKKTKNSKWAWDFIRFMSSKNEAVKYLAVTKKPAALRSLYQEQIKDEEVAVFVDQTLTAKSWYYGKDSNAAEDIFAKMIDDIRANKSQMTTIVSNAIKMIEQTR